MSYPYTKEGIAQCLKETCNTESPVIPESFDYISSEGVKGGMAKAEYEFKTEDETKYRMVITGPDTSKSWLFGRQQIYTHIKYIEKV
ncbi:MAG: hypothetical protein IJB90_06060 [Clostridia bacterium]|nr:hypothetical protein [Clostridia bacterium]